MEEPILKVRELSAAYITRRGFVRALNEVELEVAEGERVAIVGESGSGKTTLATIITRLEPPNLRVTGGSVLYKKRDLLRMSEDELRELRRTEISVIFQNPGESLNPLYTVGAQVIEALRARGVKGRGRLWEEAVELLRRVNLPQPERIMASYPHELSGGQKQRVAIAIAMAKNPRLLVADEPTTALDVSVQARILELLARINRETGVTQILITHDIGVAHDFADRIAVMYGGRVVEMGETHEVIENPMHPYTQHLVSSIPRGTDLPPGGAETLDYSLPERGCPYMPRCPYAKPEICGSKAPRLRRVNGRLVSCLLIAARGEMN